MRKTFLRCAFALALVTVACSLAQANAPDTPKEKKLKKGYGRVDIKTSPAGFPLLIDGKQEGVTYDTAQSIDLPAGEHKIEVLFPNRCWVQDVVVNPGKRHCICLNYTKRFVTRPCPYPVKVTAPEVVNDGDTITFASDVAYGGTAPLNYTWTVSPPSVRILSGAGTDTLTVDSTGIGDQRITAILVVDDGSGDPTCRQMAQATTGVLKPPPPRPVPTKFDEFPSVAFDDDKARLDNFAIEMQNSPDAQGYIFVYGGRTSRAGQADRLAERTRNYLVQTRGIDASRLVIVNGGYRETDGFEMWLVPQGAEPPRPSPTVQPSEVRPQAERPVRRTPRRRR